jgi:hypothetical protein
MIRLINTAFRPTASVAAVEREAPIRAHYYCMCVGRPLLELAGYSPENNARSHESDVTLIISPKDAHYHVNGFISGRCPVKRFADPPFDSEIVLLHFAMKKGSFSEIRIRRKLNAELKYTSVTMMQPRKDWKADCLRQFLKLASAVGILNRW